MQVKEMVLAALDKAGGVEYLFEQAKANPTAFLTLVGKVMPTQISGVDGDAIKHEHGIDLKAAPEQVLRFLAEQRIDDDKR